MSGYDPAVSGPWSDAQQKPGMLDDADRDRFCRDLEIALGDRIRADEEFAQRVWGSLANVQWQHPRDAYSMSFRSAGSLLAHMRGNDGPHNYMDFYCTTRAGVVDPDVAAALEPLGWHGETDVDQWKP